MTEQQNGRRLICLPFQGFYESWYSQALDAEESQWIEYEADERQKEEGVPEHLRLASHEYVDILFAVTDYGECHRAVAKTYVGAFNDVFEDESSRYDVVGGERKFIPGIKLGLEFESLQSPKFYNFETDRIFAYISDESISQLWKINEADQFESLSRVLMDRHTSYSGFHSYYKNELNAWLEKPLDEWDHNELSSLLLGALATFGGDKELALKLYEACVDCDGLYHEWQSGVDWQELDRRVAELRTEKSEAWKTAHPQEPELLQRCDETGDLF